MTTPSTVTVLYADHRAIREQSDSLLFKIMCNSDIEAIRASLGHYKDAFSITPMPGQDIESLCEECFDRGNVDQPTISRAGRSMSVGDIVRITLDNGASLYRVCANIGWTPFTP